MPGLRALAKLPPVDRFAREQDAIANINTRELALLGRKLYAALDKRPGKIDRSTRDLARPVRTHALAAQNDRRPVRWQLFLHPPDELPQTRSRPASAWSRS